MTAKKIVTKKISPPKPTGPRIELLDNWMLLNNAVRTMSEEEAMELIEAERADRCRPNVILRLHGRFNRLRGMREKAAWMRPDKG